MKADAIIFDKDGTLLDFDAYWVTVSVKALTDVLAHFEMSEVPLAELLAPLGVHDGVTDIDGILCKGTYAQMGEAVYDALCRHGLRATCEAVTAVLLAAYDAHASDGTVRPTCADLCEVLSSLRARGKRLAVVTTDKESITLHCLRALGVETLFDRIYTDDGKTPVKPNPYCVTDLCRLTGISPDRTVMVGDTETDVRFARNAGIASIRLSAREDGCASTAWEADAVIRSLSELRTLIE